MMNPEPTNDEQPDGDGPGREGIASGGGNGAAAPLATRLPLAASRPLAPEDGADPDATVAWVLDSRLDAAHEAVARVLRFSTPLGFCEVEVLRLEHALYEAFVNAVEHGYGNQPGHPVRVTATVAGGWLWLQVCQRGAALDPSMLAAVPVGFDDLPDLLDITGCEPRGRGLRIIKASVARCEVRSDAEGSCLVMAEPLPAAGRAERRRVAPRG